MTRKTFLYFILILIVGHQTFGQSDTLNKLNLKGKKIGYWKVLLDDKANPVDNISDSYFYGFDLWDEGEKVFKYSKRNWKNYKTTFDGTTPTKGNPIPLTGTYKCFDQKSRLIIEETYINGSPLYVKSFSFSKDKSDNNPHLFEDLDFSKRYNNIPGTFYYQEHSYNANKVDKFWFRKGPKGWRCYKIEN